MLLHCKMWSLFYEKARSKRPERDELVNNRINKRNRFFMALVFAETYQFARTHYQPFVRF